MELRYIGVETDVLGLKNGYLFACYRIDGAYHINVKFQESISKTSMFKAVPVHRTRDGTQNE